MEKINTLKKKIELENVLELNQDIIVPDKKQDIFQIRESNFYSYFSKIEISNGKVKLSGNVDSYITYLSSGEEITSLQKTIDFEDYIENNDITEDMNLNYNIEILSQEVKVINERKISISLKLKITYILYGKDTIDIFEVPENQDDLEIKTSKVNLDYFVGTGRNFANVREELKVESIDAPMDVLKVNTEISNKEVKLSLNKVLAKADFNVQITYLTRDGRVCETSEKFPIMCFVNIENVNENDFCESDFQLRNILFEINEGEDSGITVEAEFEIVCNAFENKEYEIVNDLYSLKYDLEVVSKKVEISGKDGKQEINIVQNVNKKETQNSEDYSIIVYTIKKNDTLWSISKKFRIRENSLIMANSLEEPYNLKQGSKMYIVRG